MRWLSNVAVVLVAAAIPCLAAEALLRLTAPPADSPDLFRKLPSQVEWLGRPHAQGMHTGVPVRFNQHGLRERDLPAQPSPGTVRVLALGDSVTFGMGVAQEEAYPIRTEALLNARFGASPRVEFVNFGMPGWNTLHQLAVLREIGLEYKPNIVVVGFLYNDVELSSGQRAALAAAPQAAEEDASLARKLKSGVNATVLYLKKNSLFFAWVTPRVGMVLRPLGFKGFGQVGEVKDQYVESNPNWRRVRNALLEMKQLAAERQFELVLMVIPAMAKFDDAHYPIKEYHQALAAFCEQNAIRCLDLLPAFWGLDGTALWISPTDGHPNARGHQIMAEALATALAPLVPQGQFVSASSR